MDLPIKSKAERRSNPAGDAGKGGSRKIENEYYGYYSNVSRGKRKKQNQDGLIPCILEPEESSKEYRKNWARLIQKIYEADPLTCPKCQGRMKIISFIEDEQVVKKILKHLGLWLVKQKPPPRANGPPGEIHIDYSDSQILPFDDYPCTDTLYPAAF